mmetsp:Transcript_38017/g.81208  ORF Transcript_38017/g.81208 Transcript_38017/m.81208 type:complete len:398 (-) Transcript_38017:505-1698(-)
MVGGVGLDRGRELGHEVAGALELVLGEAWGGHLLGDAGEVLDVGCLAVVGVDGHRLAGGQRDLLKGGEGGRGLGVTVLRIGDDVSDGAGDDAVGLLQGRGEAEHLLGVIDDGQQSLPAVHGGDAVVSLLLDLDAGRVGRLRGHAEEWQTQGLVGVIHAHPTLQRPSHVLESPLQLSSRGLHLGQSVQGGQRERVVSGVGDGGPAYQRGDVRLRKAEVGDRGGHAVDVVLLDDLHLAGADVHGPRGLGPVVVQSGHLGVGRAERLNEEAGPVLLPVVASAGALQKGAESHVGSLLVGLVGAAELQQGVVLGGDAEGGEALPAVNVKGPDGLAEDAGNSGEEVRDGGAGIEVVEDVAAALVEQLRVLLRLRHDVLVLPRLGLVVFLAQQVRAVRDGRGR